MVVIKEVVKVYVMRMVVVKVVMMRMVVVIDLKLFQGFCYVKLTDKRTDSGHGGVAFATENYYSVMLYLILVSHHNLRTFIYIWSRRNIESFHLLC